MTTLLDTIGIEEIVQALMEKGQRTSARRRRRQRDLDLDEYELDEVERATYGLDDDATRRLRATHDELIGDEIVDGVEGDEESDEPSDEIVDDGGDEDDVEDDEDLGEEEDEIVDTPSPGEIEAEVLAAFRDHPILRRRALEIAVDDDGVLELTGWVRRDRDLRTARRVAAHIPGVERVVVRAVVRAAVHDDDDRVQEHARAGAEPGGN